MSFVIAAPDLVAMATEDLAGIGASLDRCQCGGRRPDKRAVGRCWR